MSSIIRVDTIQKANGDTPAPVDVGLNITGNVLNLDFSYLTTSLTINTTSWTDVPGASMTITPTATTSSILIEFFANAYVGNNESSTVWSSIQFRILRDGSTVLTAPNPNTTDYHIAQFGGDNNRMMGTFGFAQIDSPSTTSSTTYKVQCFRNGSQSQYVNRYGRGGMSLTEIAG